MITTDEVRRLALSLPDLGLYDRSIESNRSIGISGLACSSMAACFAKAKGNPLKISQLAKATGPAPVRPGQCVSHRTKAEQGYRRALQALRFSVIVWLER